MLEICPPASPIYRVGRTPDPWLALDWSYAHSDGTFGNRFDDPLSYYRVLYASSQRLGCFLETLAYYRPDFSLLAEFAQIEGNNDFTPLGKLPRSWLPGRMMGTATVQGEFADIYAAEWVGYLRRELAGLAASLGFSDIDTSSLQAGAPRRLTQQASRLVYARRLNGIYYRSRHGHSLENWAVFEPFPITSATAAPIAEDDADLQHALQIFGITLTS